MLHPKMSASDRFKDVRSWFPLTIIHIFGMLLSLMSMSRHDCCGWNWTKEAVSLSNKDSEQTGFKQLI